MSSTSRHHFLPLLLPSLIFIIHPPFTNYLASPTLCCCSLYIVTQMSLSRDHPSLLRSSIHCIFSLQSLPTFLISAAHITSYFSSRNNCLDDGYQVTARNYYVLQQINSTICIWVATSQPRVTTQSLGVRTMDIQLPTFADVMNHLIKE